ncbi:MAG: DNA-binding response regulator [Gammaproteobacteria bacterium TMED1]|nr:MAG: DNA-binding response regulator [Gammaproteobacteria bacterium TMED1]
MKRILIVEDSEDLAFGLCNNLEFEGYKVLVTHDGKTGLDWAIKKAFDLVILDLTLPELDGLEVLANLRERKKKLPVLVLTARQEEIEKVRGLKSGADDYVTKPFGILELLARVEALLRRSDNFVSEVEIFGDLQIEISARIVLVEGKRIDLAPREFDLLLALVEQKGRVVSRQKLLTDVWRHQGQVVTRTVDTHIAELRRKLEKDAANPKYIQTVRKAGYRFDVS